MTELEDILITAFFQGAFWWNLHKTGVIPSSFERKEIEAEAIASLGRGHLGLSKQEFRELCEKLSATE